MAFDFPTSPTTGQEYLAESGKLYLYDGTAWTTLGRWQTPNRYANNIYKYRTIYSRGYASGGYANSSPWTNVNRTQHATDTTTNIGDLLDVACAYVDGSYSDYHQYIYGASSSFPGASAYTSSINMATEAGRTHSSNWDLRLTANGYGDSGVVINSSLTIAWITNDNANIDKHNLVTEVMYASGRGGSTGAGADYGCAWFGEFYGWVKNGTRNHKLEFSTETWSSAGLTVGTDGWGKALPTKEGWAYVKNGGNIVTGIYKINDNTGANISTSLSTPDGASGEENYQTGQAWGYCIGHYNVAQNNNAYKIVHATDVMTVGGSTMQPKGHTGMSSAATASASNQVLGGY
jgi:hypothetical protein